MEKKGFTLLELIIVIIVIGILVSMALPQFTKVAERGRIAKCKVVLDMFRKAEGIYFGLNSFYSTTIDDLTLDMPELASVDDVDWVYGVSCGDCNRNFTIRGDRQVGEYSGTYISMNQLGQIGGDHPLK